MKPRLIISAGTCGVARGAEDIINAARDYQSTNQLHDRFEIKITGCHGFCETEPNAVVALGERRIFYQKLKPDDVKTIIERTVLKGEIAEGLIYSDPVSQKKHAEMEEVPFYTKQRRLILGNNLFIDPRSIDDYLAVGGYAAIKKVLKDHEPEEVVEIVKKSGLRGRGGAGFLTGRKWELCRQAKGNVKYIICNADEGDPGAYMDRSLLEGNPHSVIEGMIIGGYAIGSREGIIYVRNEYPLAVENVGIALAQAYKKGFLGRSVCGQRFCFNIKIVRGAGAFVCGEETALLASVEGKVGRPRPRPPYPSEKGLWGKPTNINNVETWANVPLILIKGAEWFSSIGTEKSKGTKIFSLVGKIKNTGLVEVPMGITLREIVYDIGGGIPNDKMFKAVQTGGPSGGCIPREHIDLKIDYDSLAQAGSIMGSGGMIIMDEDTCMVDVAKYFLNFTQQESCGKCPSCRLGTKQMVEVLNRISEGAGQEGDIEFLEMIGNNIRMASLCGLGQTAPNPVLSTIKYFRHEYEAHIRQKRCPAVVCKEITYPPCMYTCPIDTEASVYIAQIARGQYLEAFNTIRKDNPLPGIVGRVCNHPCETKCRAGAFDKPISIRGLKRFVADWAMKNNVKYKPVTAPASGHRVAIIGSGPAGLTAAHNLALKGHAVTIFEAEEKLGGMLLLGIPEYRLPRKVLEHDIQGMMLPGIEVRTKTRVGMDITVEEIFSQGYKALLVAVGAYNSLKMGIPGEESDGVLYSMEFLRSVHTGDKAAIGKKVAVVGGGNSAIDAARVARRMGSEVTILYRRTRKEMPAFKEEVDNALLEGVKIDFLTAPARVISENGRLSALECIRMELGAPDDSGRRRPVPIKGSEHQVKFDTLLVAISEEPQTDFLKDRVRISKWHTVETDRETMMTSQPGIFAAGDSIRGPSTVIEAIRDGRLAAESIDRFLSDRKQPVVHKVKRPSVWVPPLELSDAEIADLKKVDLPAIKPAQRLSGFAEVETGYDEAMACKEARRCLRCEFETREGKEALSRIKGAKK